MKYIVLAFAAFASGFVNAVGGGGSLIAFPALLAFGYEDVAANVTTTVALWPGYIGGAIAYREELQGQRERFWRLAISGSIGAVAALPPGVAPDFDRVSAKRRAAQSGRRSAPDQAAFESSASVHDRLNFLPVDAHSRR